MTDVRTGHVERNLASALGLTGMRDLVHHRGVLMYLSSDGNHYSGGDGGALLLFMSGGSGRRFSDNASSLLRRRALGPGCNALRLHTKEHHCIEFCNSDNVPHKRFNRFGCYPDSMCDRTVCRVSFDRNTGVDFGPGSDRPASYNSWRTLELGLLGFFVP